MKIRIKFNGSLLKKDLQQYKKNISQNNTIINEEQLEGFCRTETVRFQSL